MTLALIEPQAIKLTGLLPQSWNHAAAYYLGYGRNAWHSTWINKYYPNSVSFQISELKELAEKRRVQGSVFKIENIPMIVIQYTIHAFGICPINECSGYEYNKILSDMTQWPRAHFWRGIPPSSRNRILVFSLTKQAVPDVNFKAAAEQSYSNGSNYRLGWRSSSAKSHQEFSMFSSRLIAHITSATDPAELQSES